MSSPSKLSVPRIAVGLLPLLVAGWVGTRFGLSSEQLASGGIVALGLSLLMVIWALPVPHRGGLLAVSLVGITGSLVWIPSGRDALLALVALAVMGPLLATIFRRSCASPTEEPAEAVRWALLLVTCLALIHPLGTSGLLGGGDALHYVRQSTDLADQIRAGVFPVLIGQGDQSFNGDFHPLRTAPLLPYAAGTVQLAFGGWLNPFASLNLTLFSAYVIAVGMAYLLLRATTRDEPWLAWCLALVFASSPGVLALIYSGDLHASWMTLPFLPGFFFSLIRLQTASEPGRWLATAAVNAAGAWLAHAPIGFWVSLAGSGYAFAWFISHRPWSRQIRLTAGAAVIFAVLTTYLFVSVRTLDLPNDPNLSAAAKDGTLMEQLRIGWSGLLRPASDTATSLVHDLQLSPIAWLVALSALLALKRAPKLILPGFVAVLAALALLAPYEGAAGRIWPMLPDAVLSATEKWPMQRFYPILSVLVPFLGAGAIASFRPLSRAGRSILFFLLLLGLGWAGREASKFVVRGHAISSRPIDAERKLRPENVALSRYSPEYLGPLPRNFSHGVAGPRDLTQFLERDTLAPYSDTTVLVGNESTLTWEPAESGGRFTPKLTLEPGERYRLHFAFGSPPPSGLLLLVGPSLYREYALPFSGESRAFGSAPGTASSIEVWTSSDQAEEIEVLFLGPAPAEGSIREARIGRVDTQRSGLVIERLIPYKVTTRTDQSLWLETPRLFVPGYTAHVGERITPVARSPDGYVMVPIEAGVSDVELRYPGTAWLRAAFWITILGWLGILFVAIRAGRGSTHSWEPAILRLGKGGLVVALIGGITLGGQQAWSALTTEEEPTQLPLSLGLKFPLDGEGRTEVLAELSAGSVVSSEVRIRYLSGRQAQLILAEPNSGPELQISVPFQVNYLARQRMDFALKDFGEGLRLVVTVNDQRLLSSAVESTAWEIRLVSHQASPNRLPAFSGSEIKWERLGANNSR